MANENRIMLNLNEESMATLKGLSEHTGLPITTYAKLLIQSGLPAIEPLVLALKQTDASTKDILKQVQEQLEILTSEKEDGSSVEEQLYWKNKEEQLELMESTNG
tara:strand:+ start:238 stop:552 length:315 start_codon:yes stop_codon:yes gene_type:complete